MSKPLDDKVIIITGASSGIGAATAWKLGAEGAKLVLAARRIERIERLAQELGKEGITAIAVKTDITKRSNADHLVNQAMKYFNKVDVLVNNAGVMPLSLIKNLKVDEWDRMIDTNLKGPLYAIAAVLPIMREQKSGHIVNISSIAGRRVFPGGSVYCATKFALNAFSEAMWMELTSRENIRVTLIEPGAVTTELAESITDEDVKAWFRERTQIKFLEARDIAHTVSFALTQPAHVNVNELMVMPTEQQM
jgi:NADP-dependent 3-hydroxy acid dehydrogenase YdfG